MTDQEKRLVMDLIDNTTYGEYEYGRNLYINLRQRGISAQRAAGIIYKVGYLFARLKIGKSIPVPKGVMNDD